jgi:hypothetical protein
MLGDRCEQSRYVDNALVHRPLTQLPAHCLSQSLEHLAIADHPPRHVVEPRTRAKLNSGQAAKRPVKARLGGTK